MTPYGPNVAFVYIDELEKLRKLATERDEYLLTAKKIQAEFINYQDRARTEKSDLSKFALEGFLKEIIVIRDYFQSSLVGIKDEKLAEGINLIEKEFMRILTKHGVSEIKAKGQKFDPNIHEAISIDETNTAEENTVTEDLKIGYLLNGRVLRPTMVRVAKPKSKKDFPSR